MSAAWLERAALHYLERYSASTEMLRRTLARRVQKRARARGEDPEVFADLVAATVARAVSAGLVDDARFADTRLATLRRRGTSSRGRLGQARRQGRPRDVVEAAMLAEREALPDGEAEAIDDQAAQAYAKRRRLGPHRRPDQRAAYRDRDLAALARAGFPYSAGAPGGRRGPRRSRRDGCGIAARGKAAVGLAPSSPSFIVCSMDETLAKKLRILADAAKYDASCASSAAPKRAAGKDGLGSTTGAGICHAYTPDGRCVSLLKILLTNWCLFDCAYCINRRSSNVRRAKFTVEEVVNLTLNFYRRNYIEGLFLSSGIIKSPDHTMELLTRVAKSLRRDHGFAGYIHLKSIPEASPWLIEEAGLYADRLSINVELPTEASLERLAPEKDGAAIQSAMAQIGERIVQAKAEKRRFSPAGHSTQVIVGADATTDEALIRKSALLYGSVGLKRVYYSAFSPIPDGSAILPPKPPPLAARAPAVPGRLAAAVLRLHPRRGRRRRRRAACWPSTSTRSSPGR